jgi:hypothetical protein
MGNPLVNITEGEPTVLVAGDTWTWQRSDIVGDYPVASYSLNYSMAREGDVTLPTAIVADEVNGTYQVNVSATVTAAKMPGTWRWVAFVLRTSDGARVVISSGVVTVKSDPTVAGDVRTHAVKVLTAIEALIEGRATADVSSYSIAGRSLTKLTVDELLTWRAHYRREVKRERDAANIAAGRPTGRTHVVRFS